MPLHPLDHHIISRIRRDLGPHEILLGWLLIMFMASVLLFSIVYTKAWTRFDGPRPMEVVEP